MAQHSTAVVEFLRQSIRELSQLETQLEKEIEYANKYLQYKEPSTIPTKGLDEHAQEQTIVDPKIQKDLERAQNSKLAKEKEKEIIEAIEKAKALTAQPQKSDEDFEYRPEGMFPKLGKPLTKQEKNEQLNAAYSIKPKPPNASGKPPPGNSSAKKPAPVKPSDSKYTFKNLGGKFYERNPQKITTQPKNSAQRSNSRGRQNSSQISSNRSGSTSKQSTTTKPTQSSVAEHPTPQPRTINRKEPWNNFPETTEHQSSGISGNYHQQDEDSHFTQSSKQTHSITQTKVDRQEQVQNYPSKPSPTTKPSQPSPHLPTKSPPGSFPFSTALLSSLEQRTQVNSTPPVNKEQSRLLNVLSHNLTSAQTLSSEYSQALAAENKRSALAHIAHKTMCNYAIQTCRFQEYYERLLAEERRKEDNDEDSDGDGNDKRVPLPKLTPPVVNIKQLDFTEVENVIDNIYNVPEELTSPEDNEDLQKLLELEKAGYFDPSSEEYQDMLSLLSNARGLKSAQGQELLANLYSCWFFSEEFVNRYSSLKQMKSSLENTMAKVMEKLSKPEVFKTLSLIEPVANSILYKKAEHLPKPEKKELIEDYEMKLDNMLAEYYSKLKTTYLASLKQRFDKLKASESKITEKEHQKALVAFLQDMQEIDRLFKTNSRLPLIFHMNFAETEAKPLGEAIKEDWPDQVE